MKGVGKRLNFFMVFIAIFFMSGCGFHSQRVLKDASLGFNAVLHHTVGEQMLLNLVRLRYGEGPIFLEVASISTQHSFSGNAGASASIKEAMPDSYGVSLGLSYSEKPTVTLVPLQGEEFARRLLSPVPVEHIIILLNSGWRLDRVLRLCIQSMNDIPNAPTASGPTPSAPPEFKRFLRLSRLFEVLREKRGVRFGYVQHKGQLVPALRFIEDTLEARQIRDMLGIKDAPYHVLLGPEATISDDTSIRLETRSLIGVLFYLSHGIDVPLHDLDSNRAVKTLEEDGSAFFWGSMLSDIFHIRSADSYSLLKDAMIAVRYRGSWFYISDTDSATKSTFILLQQLFALEASKGKVFSPVLTIPVS